MRLERVAGSLEALHTQMGEEGLDSLYFFNVPSMESAVGAIETFAEEATKSWFAYVSGNPYTENSIKTRTGVVDASKVASTNGEKKPRKKAAKKAAGGAREKGEE